MYARLVFYLEDTLLMLTVLATATMLVLITLVITFIGPLDLVLLRVHHLLLFILDGTMILIIHLSFLFHIESVTIRRGPDSYHPLYYKHRVTEYLSVLVYFYDLYLYTES